MNRWIVAAAVLSFSVASSQTAWAEQKPYTLKDLQALDARQAWPELQAHLEEVPPTERTTDWNRMVEHACIQPGQMEDYLAAYCMDDLKSVLHFEPQNQEFAWKAGKWARVNQNSWAAIPFFAAAIQKPGDARCQDKDVLLALVSGLDLPATTDGEVVKQSQELAFQKCWPAVKDTVMKGFGEESGSYRANTCPDLKKKSALSNLQSKRCDAKE